MTMLADLVNDSVPVRATAWTFKRNFRDDAAMLVHVALWLLKLYARNLGAPPGRCLARTSGTHKRGE